MGLTVATATAVRHQPLQWSSPSGLIASRSSPTCPPDSPNDAHFHAGVAPTGRPADIHDLPAAKGESRRSMRFSRDTQTPRRAELAYLRDDIMAGIPDMGAAFAINHGDVVFDDLALYARYLQIVGATGIPWHHCPGNHDINWDGRDDRSSRETWKRVFGPRHYAFQHGDAGMRS